MSPLNENYILIKLIEFIISPCSFSVYALIIFNYLLFHSLIYCACIC